VWWFITMLFSDCLLINLLNLTVIIDQAMRFANDLLFFPLNARG